MKWFEYPILVPFGDRKYDVALGGSHDLTYATPPNTEITSLTDSTVITDISSPSWGKQVTVKLKKSFSGHDHFAYLHLSAVNPELTIGHVLHYNDVIGWSGGCNSQGEYDGTHNPTGQNFTNTPEMSSHAQVGIALCDGMGYGYAGWSDWTKGKKIDTTLDPLPVVEAYIEAMKPPPIDYVKLSFDNQFKSLIPDLSTDSGIANLAYESYVNGDDHGPALTREFDVFDKNGVKFSCQCFPMGCYWWNHDSHTGTWKPYRD